MKKTAVLLALTLIVGSFFAIPIGAAEKNTEIDITSEFNNIVRGEWELKDGILSSLEANGAIGDAIAMTDLYIDSSERSTLSADITITGGNNGAAGFCIAELDPSLPIEGGCVLTPLDISAGQAKLFAHNAQTSVGSYLNVSTKLNETFNMRFEVYDDGTLEVYINDELTCQGFDTNFPGGYIGLYTFSGVAQFKNITLSYDGENHGTGDEIHTVADAGTYNINAGNTTDVSGIWEKTGGKLSSSNVGNQGVTMTDYYFSVGKHITVTSDVKLSEGDFVSVILAERSKMNPLGAGALIFNIAVDSENGKTSVYSKGTTYNVSSQYVGAYEYNKVYNLRLDVFENGDIQAYIDGELIHNISNTGFTGGYLGLYTENSVGSFENTAAVYGGEAPERVSTETSDMLPEDTTIEETGKDTETSDSTVNTTETAENSATTDVVEDEEEDNTTIIIIVAAVAIVLAVTVVTVVIVKKKKQ